MSEIYPSLIQSFWHQKTVVIQPYLYQNPISVLVFYNGLTSIKIPVFIQTFTQSFLLSSQRSFLVFYYMKNSLRDPFSLLL